MAAATIGGAQAQVQAREKTYVRAEAGGIYGLEMQIIMVVLGIIASVLAIITLQGIDEKKSEKCADKDYRYLVLLPKIGIVLSLIVAIYFMSFAYKEHQDKPENMSLNWIFYASLLVLAAVLIKTKIIFGAREPSDAVIEGVVE